MSQGDEQFFSSSDLIVKSADKKPNPLFYFMFPLNPHKCC